jgi:hypothetical protein
MESVGAIGGELGVRDGSRGFGSFGEDGRRRNGSRWFGSGGRRCWLRNGKAGFAGELAIFVRGGTAFFAVHIDVSFGRYGKAATGFFCFKTTARTKATSTKWGVLGR